MNIEDVVFSLLSNFDSINVEVDEITRDFVVVVVVLMMHLLVENVTYGCTVCIAFKNIHVVVKWISYV